MSTPPPAIELRPRSVGELLDLTFNLYRRYFLPWVSIALIVMGPLMALALAGSGVSLVQLFSPFAALATANRDSGAMSTALAASLISLCATGLSYLGGVFAPWMGGALTFNVIERALGRAPAWRDSYRATLPRWAGLWSANAIRQIALIVCLVPLVIGAYGLLFGALLGLSAGESGADTTSAWAGAIGLMLLCLPIGLIGLVLAVLVAVNWSLSEPAIVGEGAGALQSLSRSNTLIKGMRWRMLGRLLIFWIMQFFVVSLPIGVLQIVILGGSAASAQSGDLSPLTVIGFVGSTLFGIVANVLIVPLNVAYTTLNYLDLRVRKEQLDLQIKAAQLAAAPPAVAPPAVALEPSEAAPSAISQMEKTDAPPAQRIRDLYARIQAEGPTADLLNELGLAYHAAGDLNGALDALTRARDLAFDDADITFNLAMLQRDRRDLGEARRLMSIYLRLETDETIRQRVLANPALKEVLP